MKWAICIILWNINPYPLYTVKYNFDNITLHNIYEEDCFTCFGMRLKVNYMDIYFTVAKLLWICMPFCKIMNA